MELVWREAAAQEVNQPMFEMLFSLPLTSRRAEPPSPVATIEANDKLKEALIKV